MFDHETLAVDIRDQRRAGARTQSQCLLLGSLSALAVLLVLGFLELAMISPMLAEGTPPNGFGRLLGGWLAFSLLLAFMFGGYIAVRTAAIRDAEDGIRAGAQVFLIASPLVAWLLVGGLVGVTAAFLAYAPAELGRTAVQVRDAAWLILIGCPLGLMGGAFGGLLAATRRQCAT